MSLTLQHPVGDDPTVDATHPQVCCCGQDLELCTGGHCPRCGTLLTSGVGGLG